MIKIYAGSVFGIFTGGALASFAFCAIALFVQQENSNLVLLASVFSLLFLAGSGLLFFSLKKWKKRYNEHALQTRSTLTKNKGLSLFSIVALTAFGALNLLPALLAAIVLVTKPIKENAFLSALSLVQFVFSVALLWIAFKLWKLIKSPNPM